MKKILTFLFLISILFNCAVFPPSEQNKKSDSEKNQDVLGLLLLGQSSGSSSSSGSDGGDSGGGGDSGDGGDSGGSVSGDARTLMNIWSSLSLSWKEAIVYNAKERKFLTISLYSGPTSSQANQVVELQFFTWDPKPSSSSYTGSTSKITTLRPFQYFKKLSHITLYNNDIYSIPVDVFKYNTELTDIALAANDISVIYDGSFNGLSKVKNLYLYSNKIGTLPFYVFDGSELQSLEKLSLFGNEIQSDNISNYAFANLDNLTELELAYQQDNNFYYYLSDTKLNRIRDRLPYSCKITYSIRAGKRTAWGRK